MAFHPFRVFRKHRKVLLAALTIMAMFLFVLTGATNMPGADALDSIVRWVSYATGAGDRGVATIDGKAYTERDLEVLRVQRQIAHQFLFDATARGHRDAVNAIERASRKMSPIHQQTLTSVIMARAQRMSPFSQLSRQDLLPQIQRDLASLQSLAAEMEREGKFEDAARVRELMAVLRFDGWLVGRRPNELYFGGTTDTEDLLDFLVWRAHANKLGIELTTEDVRKEVRRDTLVEDTDEQLARGLREFARGDGNITEQLIETALKDEYRVQLAQMALLGYASGVRGLQGVGPDGLQEPAVATPWEFWKYFRDNRTVVKAALLPVPVASFVDKVKEEPTERELRALYDRYKEAEFTPERSLPAFKEPRRVRVAWARGKAESPHYQKASAQATEALLAATRWASHTPPLTGAGPPSMTPLGLLMTRDLALLGEYQRFAEDARFDIESGWRKTHESSHAHAENAAATLGLVVGSSGTLGTPFSAPFALQGNAYAHEARLRTLSTAVAALAGPSPADRYTHLTSLALPGSEDPKVPALEAVKDRLTEKISKARAQGLLAANLDNFVKELGSRRSKPQEAEKWAQQAVKDYGLEYGVSEDGRHLYELADAPALQPFKEAFLKAFPTAKPLDFARLLTARTGVYSADGWSGDMQQLFQFGVMDGWRYSPEPFLYWRTEDKAAKPLSFEDARERVARAWKFQKARKLAEEEAERVKKAVAAERGGDVVRVLNENGFKERGFELEDVARLVKRTSFAALKTQYERYLEAQPPRLPADKLAYPPPDLVEQLLTLDKSARPATVVKDRPESVYYVAVLLNRAEPTFDDFFKTYEQTHAPVGDGLWDRLEAERRRTYKDELVKQLRAAVSKVDDQGKVIISEEARARLQNRESAE